MRWITLTILSLILFATPHLHASENSAPAWKMMNQVEAECAGSTAVRSSDAPSYYTTFDESNIRFIVVESIKASPRSGSRVAKQYHFGDMCYVNTGALLVEVARGPTDTVLVQVEENEDQGGFNNQCPKDAKVILSLARWQVFVKAQRKRDDAQAKQECVNKKLRDVVREIHAQARETLPQ